MKSLVRFSSILGLLASCITAIGVSPALADQATFLPTGAEQTFVVPANVTSVHALAIGGRGADVTNGGKGGSGASVGADIAVTPGQTLYIEIGANGSGTLGGFNGGAPAGSGFPNAGGGGGATDIRTAPRVAGTSLGVRLLVAGGGGGGGSATPSPPTTNYGGSAGPSPTFGTGYSVGGAPGTSFAGGVGGGGCESGSTGTLGDGGAGAPGGTCGPSAPGGGGEGGLFGGGGGGSSSAGSAGGPGSSFFGTGVTNPTIATDTTGLPSVTLIYSATAAVPAPVVPTTPPPPAPVTPTAPAPPPTTATLCKVPNLTGRSLQGAREALAAANCKLGTVKRQSKSAQKVVGQTPKSGGSATQGTAINVTLGGSHRRHPR